VNPVTVLLPYVLVTGNPGKLAEARRLAGAGLGAVALDLPEIQSLDLLEVLRHKGEEAWRRLGRPLVVEEAGLDLAALGGFPGPLVKWMLEAAGAGTIARAALALGDPRAVARAALYYRDAGRTLVAEGSTAGTLVLPARGEQGFGWDPVFQPDGLDRTFGELTGTEKDALSHRGKAWRQLLASLEDPRT
jgi:XTP/dITP diphosphohydrolase